MRKIIIYFLIFSDLVLAVSYAAIFYISQLEIINANLEKAIQYGKPEMVRKEKEAVYLEDFLKIKENLILSEASFVEVNLSQMKVAVWQQGVLKNEFPILLKGDPQGWGGSAIGFYKVISKNKLSYSIISEVYMPYAVHYYGKYYLHGEPYYSDGEKRFSDITGGCVQLSDKDAKTIFNLIEKETPVLVIDRENDNYQYPIEKISQFPKLSAKSYVIADLDSGFVFAEKDFEEKLPVASLAKLMTAVVVSENVDLRKSIQITSKMLEGYGLSGGLDVGKNFRVVELFYPLLISSSNDAALALSYFLSWDKTVKLMNEKAKAILMENTEFVGPGGFAAENVSTAQDLFYLARYVLNNRPPLLKITKGEQVQAFGEIRFQNSNNKNLFFEDPNFIGGKTGYIPNSKYNGIFIFRFPVGNNSERRIAIILLGSAKLDDNSEGLKNDTEKIIDWLKENYFKEGN